VAAPVKRARTEPDAPITLTPYSRLPGQSLTPHVTVLVRAAPRLRPPSAADPRRVPPFLLCGVG
jgi:hypothetical protein